MRSSAGGTASLRRRANPPCKRSMASRKSTPPMVSPVFFDDITDCAVIFRDFQIILLVGCRHQIESIASRSQMQSQHRNALWNSIHHEQTSLRMERVDFAAVDGWYPFPTAQSIGFRLCSNNTPLFILSRRTAGAASWLALSPLIGTIYNTKVARALVTIAISPDQAVVHSWVRSLTYFKRARSPPVFVHDIEWKPLFIEDRTARPQ